MNRAARRRAASKARSQGLGRARADGRPLYFDIGKHDHVTCFYCNRAGISGVRYGEGKAVMNDPANPPEGCPQGEMHTICVYHLPDNAVIYNPRTNYCRNKSGDHTWEEGEREDVRPELRGAAEGR